VADVLVILYDLQAAGNTGKFRNAAPREGASRETCSDLVGVVALERCALPLVDGSTKALGGITLYE
jgi:hypothetical protein